MAILLRFNIEEGVRYERFISVITRYKTPAMVLTNSGRLYQWTQTMSLVRTWEKHILYCRHE
jgi:hypothetical protein